jgi:hypothetical protein
MKIAMKDEELSLFRSFLRCSNNYLEFGAGGSTVLAASLVTETVLSIDSSQEWLGRVEKSCIEEKTQVQPELVHVDIGDTKEWGYPINKNIDWTRYHSAIWERPLASHADLFLIDGRFRVACFMQVVLRSQPNAVVCMHDFRSRKQYHIIKEVAREVAVAGDFSAFVRQPGFVPAHAAQILQVHRLAAD